MTIGSVKAWARRMVVGLSGAEPTADEVAWIRQWKPAGVILFARNVLHGRQLRELTAFLHGLDPNLEIVADHEGGPVSQLEAAVGRPPAPWTLGDLDDPALTRACWRVTGLRCRAAGIDRVLGPGCDVLTELRNPVIGSRAFGADEERVARHVAAAVAGLRDAGMTGCAKHWPGHGGSRQDSHLQLARVGNGALSGPFGAAAQAGADAVMIGHLLPQTPAEAIPASLDPAAIERARSLFAQYGNAPLIYADDITMGALREYLGPDRAVPEAGPPSDTGMVDPGALELGWFESVAAGGCDRFLIRGIPWAAFPLAATPDVVAAPAPSLWPDDGDSSDDGPYREALRRAAGKAGWEDFSSPHSDLIWVDATAGDRWQGTGGSRVLRDLEARLRERFRTVLRTDPASPVGVDSYSDCNHLLVTSHRPLPSEWTEALPGRWLDSGRTGHGRCLVMGHPSLAEDLPTWLGKRWYVSALSELLAIDCVG